MLKIPLNMDGAGDGPLYYRLYAALVEQIRGGALPRGSRLPGKRTLAADLGISVNTVDTAYQMLAAEGYVEARSRSGFTVQDISGSLPVRRETPREKPAAPAAEREEQPETWRYDLLTGGIDTDLFPFRTWGRIQRELLYGSPELLRHGKTQGDDELRQALADYLIAYRGVRCGAEQIVVGAGLEYLMSMLAPLLGGSFAIEDPGYGAHRRVLEAQGLKCFCIPVDREGLSVAQLEQTDADLCYVTPSHQYPTGVSMPVTRRAALLRWAAAAPGRRYILEDDYDSEFRFEGRPLPSLQGMAGEDGPVVYLSTVSKSLAPGIRIAYLVLPRHLLPLWQERYGGYACTVGRFEQQTFARFLREGYFTRHLARMRNTCRARRDALVHSLRQSFGAENITLQGLDTGLHLLLTLREGPDEAEMVRRARGAGVRISGLSEYSFSGGANCPPRTVAIGYGTLPPEEAPAVAELLKRLWTES